MIHPMAGTFAKSLGLTLAHIVTRPMVWRCRLLTKFLGQDRAVLAFGEKAATWAGPWGVLKRAAFYRSVLAFVGRDVHIGYGSIITKASAQLHDRVYLGRYCGVGSVTLGNDSLIADNVQVLSGRHHHAEQDQVTLSHIHVGPHAWIGANTVVMSDVGSHCVVAAGAVVVKPVSDHISVAGVPAKPMQSLQNRAA